eukprot:TRINITY_DN598_c0_g1_i1.p1 TRINITY_DN598_c0_g1~~TRINITY_DN598_c0_g1_i1.p1  ORF type:complete len:419 (+),score=125.84 TRINITY_DN598_c0_g1_i1:98-1354(+)
MAAAERPFVRKRTMRLAGTVGLALAGCAALSAWRRGPAEEASAAFVGGARLQPPPSLAAEQASVQSLRELAGSRIRLAAEGDAEAAESDAEGASPKKNDRVTVATEFESDSEPPVKLTAGMKGTVEEVDDEDGAVRIAFDDLDTEEWVPAADFDKLTVEGSAEALTTTEETMPENADGRNYPASAYMEYAYDKTPPEAWWNRRKIDRHKVNMVFFDMYKKPKKFFPHDLRPGDTVRIYFMDPAKGETVDWKKTREVFFDGVILNFKGQYHSRNIRVRAMVGSREGAIGYEMTFPMHSPLVTKIEVLRRGYIGRNKNAYFLRAMIGKKNQIPLDKERQALDELYQSLREEGREDEIPEPEYPQQEWDRYPVPVWKQSQDEWEEEKYNPDNVDTRSQYETRVIAQWRKRPKQTKARKIIQ